MVSTATPFRPSLLPALLIAVSLCTIAPLARAQPSGDAKATFEEGYRFFEAEEFEAALPFFERAYELSNKRPAAIFALAQCLRSLKRYEAAIERFEEYARAEPGKASEVKETLKLLRIQLDKKRAAALRRAEKAAAKERAQAKAKAKSQAEIQKKLEAERAEAEALRAQAAKLLEAAKKSQAKRAAQAAQKPMLTPPKPTEPKAVKPLTQRPVFWVLTALGAALVGGAVTTGVVLGTRDRSPYSGSSGVLLKP